jgi:hypothetical protein
MEASASKCQSVAEDIGIFQGSHQLDHSLALLKSWRYSIIIKISVLGDVLSLS